MSSDDSRPIYASIFAILGAASAMSFSALGAAFGIAKTATGIGAISMMKPDLIIKGMVPVVMAGIVAIYGLVIAVLIANQVNSKITLFGSFLHLGAGLSTGLCGMSAGFAVGIIGDTGIRGVAYQPRFFVGMMLILVFAAAPGLYGLIISLVLSTKINA